MKKLPIFATLILTLLLSACANTSAIEKVETMTVITDSPATSLPTLAPTSAEEEQPAPVPPPEEELVMLRANPWQWVAFNNPMEQSTIENAQNYVVTFNDDATANILADCNNANGSYITDGSSISITVGPMTMAACPSESRSDDFVKYLGSSAIYFFKDGHLFIDLFADGGTLEFAPFETAPVAIDPLTANTWRWEKFTNPMEQVDVPNPNNYTFILLDSDKSVVVYADCNTLIGTYTLEESVLKIALDTTTLVSCPPESLSDRYLEYLQTPMIYKVQDNRLLLDLPADGGTLQFGIYNYEEAQREQRRVSSWDEVPAKFLEQNVCDAPGFVLLADTPQGRYLRAQGLASTEDGTPMETGDSFEIGSNTKSFTTALALQLQEEGVWNLDDPLSKYLPQVAAKLPFGDQITLRHLAQNKSGIPDYANPLIGEAIEKDKLEQGYKPNELVDYAVEKFQPSFEPGQGWEYSTTNFIILGMAIEVVTVRPLEELYQARIFEPLEMNDTFLLQGVPEPGQIVQGYYTDKQTKNVTAWNGTQGWAGGGIVSTAEDMAKFATGLTNGLLFKDPSSLQQYLDFEDLEGLTFDGYGLGTIRWSQDPFAWGHAGQTPGFQTLWAVFPEQESHVVMLTNSGSCKVEVLMAILTASPDLFTQDLPSLASNKKN